jgi:hypothetical protein
MTETSYCAITGDLVGSKALAPTDRVHAQRATLAVLEALDAEWARAFVRPLIVTAGDEVQGLLRDPAPVPEILRRLTDRLDALEVPSAIAFGVGFGPLSTGELSEAARVEELDGPCFHRAREALQRAKRAKLWVVHEGLGEVEDLVLDSLFELMGAIRSGWTPTQKLYIREARRRERRIDVAKHVGVSPSVVTESLQSSHFDALRRAEEAARAFLERNRGSHEPV